MPKRVTIQATSHSTPKSSAIERRMDMDGPRSSPLTPRSGMFYQPSDHRPDDLPEADQKALRKNSGSLYYDKPEAGATAVGHSTRAAIPSYEEATRRNIAVMRNEVTVTPKRDNLVRTTEIASSKSDRNKSHGDSETKKSSIWYEYGDV